VTIALGAVRGIIETTQGLAPEAWQRHLDIYVAGLRPAADPLPDRELSREKLDELITERLRLRETVLQVPQSAVDRVGRRALVVGAPPDQR
jgi:hypothetical protein